MMRAIASSLSLGIGWCRLWGFSEGLPDVRHLSGLESSRLRFWVSSGRLIRVVGGLLVMSLGRGWWRFWCSSGKLIRIEGRYAAMGVSFSCTEFLADSDG